MRYLYLIQQEKEFQGPPPARLMEEMGKLMGRRIAEGSLIDTAGLTPSAQAVRVTLKRGQLNVMDGPFAESSAAMRSSSSIRASKPSKRSWNSWSCIGSTPKVGNSPARCVKSTNTQTRTRSLSG